MGDRFDDRSFQDVHTELTKRFNDFKKLHDEILKEAKLYHNYGTSVHLTIIILGAVSAAQATFKDQMGADSRGTIFLFTVLAILMTIGAGLESFCKWNKKSGALCSLAIGCAVFQYKWYDRWHKVASEYAAERNESNLRKVFKLADDHLKASNSKIIEIQNKAAALGMIDLALKSSFLSPEDKFKVPLEHKRIDPSSGGNGRSVEGQAIPQYSNGDRGLLIRERH